MMVDLYSVLYCTPRMKMANDLVSIFGVNGQLLYILTLGIVIKPDAFAIGFGERMCTFSQEKRALNPVRIVS